MSQVCGPIWIMRMRLTTCNRHKNPMNGLPITFTDCMSIHWGRVWPLAPLSAAAAERFPNAALWYYCGASIKMLLFSFCFTLCVVVLLTVLFCVPTLCRWILMSSMLMALHRLRSTKLLLWMLICCLICIRLSVKFPHKSLQLPPYGEASAPRATAQKQCGHTVCIASNPHQSLFRLPGHSGFTLCKMKVMG